jgi:hypothetical protein
VRKVIHKGGRKSSCLKDDGKQFLASEGSERGHGLGEEESDSASGLRAGLMSLPQDLLASILKDVAFSGNCKESQYSVGQHVEVDIHENSINLKPLFENSLNLKSLVSGWWGATISSVVESGSEKMYKIKWDKLPAEHAKRCREITVGWKSPWDATGPFHEDQIRLHHHITPGGRRKDSTWATQTRAKIFTVQNTFPEGGRNKHSTWATQTFLLPPAVFPNYRKLSSHVLAASRAAQLSLINAECVE